MSEHYPDKIYHLPEMKNRPIKVVHREWDYPFSFRATFIDDPSLGHGSSSIEALRSLAMSLRTTAEQIDLMLRQDNG